MKNSADKLDNENMNACTQLAVWRNGGSSPAEKAARADNETGNRTLNKI